VIFHAPSAEARQCAHFLEHLDGVAAGVAAEAAALRTLEQAEVKRIETTEHDLRQRHQALHEAMGAAADLLGYRGKNQD
jgi:Tfp pilus assembly protein PilN